jgi:uncharacterized membrane protein YdfJ with MMPL/SSD domain
VIPKNTEKGVKAFVGGSTASNVDLAAEISSRLPLVIVTILILSMLVLLVAFRSVLIPLQAAATTSRAKSATVVRAPLLMLPPSRVEPGVART